jgi:O-antigen/teichoic acid export membrane protein
VGALAGSLCGAVVCVITSPIRLRLRFDRATVREYASFSWPLVGLGLSQLLTVQGSLLVANRAVGIAGVAAIGLSTGIAAFTDRVDGIVSQTLYPAVCAVADRMQLLREVFIKSNRVALMWAMPFAVGLALFAKDLVHFVLGDKWLSAVGLLQAVGLALGLGQVAFNWGVFMRATNRTRPLFVAALLQLAVFAVVAAPATLLWGLRGYAASVVVGTLVQIVARGYYLRGLFGSFSIVRQTMRGIAPTIPGVAVIVAVRWLAGGQRSGLRFAAELALYAIVACVSTALLERRLLREILGYFRKRLEAPPAPPVTARAASHT